MKLIRIATSNVNQTPLDWNGNLERLLLCISDAKNEKARLLCLPELSITGYGCEDQFLAPSTTEQALDSLKKLIPLTKGIAVAVGLPLRHQNAIYNTVAMIADGDLLGFYAKQNLAGDGIHYEPRWFRPWPKNVSLEVNVLGKTVPLGDILFDIGDVRIGFEVCEDAWVADRPGRRYAEYGVDIILNPSASHFAFGKQKIREQFVREGSRAFGVTYVYANLVGNEAGRIIYDGGSMIASNGNLIAQGERFSFQETTITSAVVDLDLHRLAQAQTASRQAELKAFTSVKASFNWPQESHPSKTVPAIHYSKEVEFTRAVTLALFDYMRKSHSNGFVISLSGGADSAAVACLVAIMHQIAKQELSPEDWQNRLGYLGDKIPDLKKLLICVYQATDNSGDTTRHAAETLANALGAEYAEWQVQDSVNQYIGMAEKTIGRTLTWETDDITLQNIQARVRAPGVWMLANLRNALLLTTSNRSEAAVGYATMDGDTCGGLAPIGGIDKAFLLHWLRWLETEGSADIPALPVLKIINQQQPTAELRPADQGQSDESDLMPYPILDQIERWAIRDKKAPTEVHQLLTHRFPNYQNDTLKKYVIHFFRLWSRNQWKRERYAPSFHLDDQNLDPKTWCRFPILNAGFEEELSFLNPPLLNS